MIGPHTVAYLDLVGSGAETIAHLRENGRIVVMFCAFEGPPRIVRLHGRGEVLLPGDEGFDGCSPPSTRPSMRALVIRVDVERIADSCGYGVPLMTLRRPPPAGRRWADSKVRTGRHRRLRGGEERRSIDGLPAIENR